MPIFVIHIFISNHTCVHQYYSKLATIQNFLYIIYLKSIEGHPVIYQIPFKKIQRRRLVEQYRQILFWNSLAKNLVAIHIFTFRLLWALRNLKQNREYSIEQKFRNMSCWELLDLVSKMHNVQFRTLAHSSTGQIQAQCPSRLITLVTLQQHVF